MSKKMGQIVWTGEENRPFGLRRPCECGCDFREGIKGIGYLTYSDSEGNGFTIWIETEEVYQRLAQAMRRK